MAGFADRVLKNLTSYDIVAMTVVSMVLGHVVFFFEYGSLWWRVPDRILWPIFFVPIGYNVGRKLDYTMIYWGVFLAIERYDLLHPYFIGMGFFPLPILISIIAARLCIQPMMEFAIKNRWRFWGTALALTALVPVTNEYVSSFGTLIPLLAMAGWLLRNRDEIPKGVVDVKDFFVFCFIVHGAIMQSIHNGPPVQLAIVLAGNAVVFWLLYNYRQLLLNAVRRRPKDAIEKFCSFLGHKSFEIYAVHLAMIYAAYWWAIA